MIIVDDKFLDFRVCSFNIRYGTANDGGNSWPHRQDMVVRAIQTISPDILALQECMPFQLEYIQRHLPEYDAVAAGRDDGIHGEMVPILFRRSRFCCVAGGHFWLSETPHIAGSRAWGAPLPRMATWAALQSTGRDGGFFHAINTHLDYESRDARKHSCELLRARIDALFGSIPVLLTGDFNAEPLASELAPLFASSMGPGAALTDVLSALPGGTFHGFSGHPMGRRIDWILTTPPFVTDNAKVDTFSENGRFPSDHFAVYADVSMR